jgi:hypothetical protein
MTNYSSNANLVRQKPFVDSTPLLESGDFTQLRQRASEDGHLFFKGLLPPQELQKVRQDMLAVVEKYGWRQPAQDADGRLIDLEALNQVPDEEMRSDIGVSREAYYDIQRLSSFHKIPHHPKLIALYQGLFEDEVFVHPRHIARMITAHRVVSPTPPHQDFPLVQGSTNTWTCWFPLADCTKAHGSLTVLQGSHQEGYIPIQREAGAGGIAVQLCQNEEVWVEGDYEVGDVLTFPCYTVHKALPSQYRDLIRLSIDARYQAISEPIEEKSLKPHCSLTWEEVYANWDEDNLKYYWQEASPSLSPWDDTLLQPAKRIC